MSKGEVRRDRRSRRNVRGRPGQRIPQAKTGYASVNGLDVYYEIHGVGGPVVLLHG
jgi:hypothetical protein